MRALRGTIAAIAIAAVFGGTAAATAQAQSIQLTPVATGLSSPVFATPQGGDLYVVERAGVIKKLSAGQTTTFLDITNKVLSAGTEQGLLGLAFTPGQGTSKFYVDYTRHSDGAVVVSEFDNGLERVLLTIAKPAANHNGGMLAFGPDGKLYIGVGDGGGANDTSNNAQNRGLLLGKVLRIDPAPSGSTPYTVPPDNPFVGQSGARPEIWAFGLRNPWRFSFETGTGTLWLGDVGQGNREEVDQIAKGGNYGWRVFEGTSCTGLDLLLCNQPGYLPPVTEYGHTNGRCAITGGYAYRGTLNTLPAGSYVYGDYCSGEIFLHRSGNTNQVLLDTTSNISSFGQLADGELLVVTLNGTVYRIDANTTPPPPPPPPDPCARPSGPVSGLLWSLGLTDLARAVCRAGL